MIKKLNLALIISFLCIILISYISIAIEQNVIISVTPKPKIDIALAKAKTATDLTNFEEDVLAELQRQNIDTSDVRISALQAEQVDITESFTWQRDVSSTIGSISIVNNGQRVVMKGNTTNQGKNAIWIIPDENNNEDQKFTFRYNIIFGDSFYAAGMLLKVKQNGNKLTGYMLSFNNDGTERGNTTYKDACGGYLGAIWEFEYYIGQNNYNITKKLRKGLNINKSGTLTVSTTDTEIIIEGGGLSSPETYEIEKEFGNGFGFFSDHYSHDCSEIGSFTLNNINLTTVATKKFEEVLRQPDWRKGSYRFLVNVTDRQNDELKEDSKYGELVTRLTNDSIYFVGLGQEKNEEQFTKLVEQNNNKGIFIENTDYEKSIQETAKYIRKALDEIEDSEYVIANEPSTITINPEEARNNTQNDDWLYGKWKIEHDYEYYENNLGQFLQSGKYIPDFINTFDKTGRFKITYMDCEITPKYVYVHRRPKVKFTMQLSDGDVTLESQSYDLDALSNNNGISEEEWKWRTSDQTTWNTGKLEHYDMDKTYIIQLRVKDFQETWSNPITKFIYNGDDAVPIAMFELEEDNISKYEQIEVDDQSYDPSGKAIVGHNWEIYKDSNLVYSGNTIPADISGYELGSYTIYLTVTNSNGAVSEQVSRKFNIIDDLIAPEVTADPIESDWTPQVTVNLSFYDLGGSGFKQYKYAITDSQSTPPAWSGWITNQNDQLLVNQEGGNKYIHIITEDNAGNISEDRAIGVYKIDNTIPNIRIAGNLDIITTEEIKVEINVDDDLSGVKEVTVNGENFENGSEYTITKNGNYTVVATDNAGNIETKDITVENIERICTAGLGHPNYDSHLDKCPICELLKNVQINEDSNTDENGNIKVTYDGLEHRVQYQNPDNMQIVEYYNGSKEAPKKVGTYSYELKIVHEYREYSTNYKGNIEIVPKDITISNISTLDKLFDNSDIIQIAGGELNGVIEGDDVSFVLPSVGKATSSEIGHLNVQIDEITLIGKDKDNYNLIQPKLTDVQVNILDPDAPAIYLEPEVDQINGKEYQKQPNDKVRVATNDLIHLKIKVGNRGVGDGYAKKVEVKLPDEIEFIQDNTINKNYGWTLENNNILTTTVMALENGETNKIPGKPVARTFMMARANTKNGNEEHYLELNVKAKELPKEYKDFEVNFDVVQTDINNTIIEDSTQSEETKLVLRTNYANIVIKQYVDSVNGEKVDGEIKAKVENGKIVYEKSEQEIEAEQKDIIVYGIRAYNQGEIDAFVSKLSNTAGKGLEFITDNNINSEYKWKMLDKDNQETEDVSKAVKFITDYLADKEIKAFDGEKVDYQEIKIAFRISENSDTNAFIENTSKIEECKDLNQNIVENINGNIGNNGNQNGNGSNQNGDDSNSDSDSDVTKIRVKQFDLSLKQYLSKIQGYENGEYAFEQHYEEDDSVPKIEIHSKLLDKTVMKITYDITIKNEGRIAGYAKEVKDYIPEELEFLEEDNPEWTKVNSNIVITDQLAEVEIKPEEEKTVSLVLTWKKSGNNLGNIINIAEISKEYNLSGTKDIDSIVDNLDAKEDDYDFSKLIVSIMTGEFLLKGVYLIIDIIVLSWIYIRCRQAFKHFNFLDYEEE